MPIFCPSNSDAHGRGLCKSLEATSRLNLDRDVHARRQVEFLQLVHRLRGRLDDVEQTLVGADFKLVHRFLVDVRGAVHREFFDQRRQRNRPGHPRAGALRGLDDSTAD